MEWHCIRCVSIVLQTLCNFSCVFHIQDFHHHVFCDSERRIFMSFVIVYPVTSAEILKILNILVNVLRGAPEYCRPN